MTALAPIPKARVTTTVTVKPFSRARERAPTLRSRRKDRMCSVMTVPSYHTAFSKSVASGMLLKIKIVSYRKNPFGVRFRNLRSKSNKSRVTGWAPRKKNCPPVDGRAGDFRFLGTEGELVSAASVQPLLEHHRSFLHRIVGRHLEQGRIGLFAADIRKLVHD